MVMIVIMVPIAVAPCPRIFQVAAPVLCLAAVFTMLAFCILQLMLCIAYLLFAFSVVVTVYRTHGDRSAQERQNNKRGNECFDLLKHASLLGIASTSYALMHIRSTINDTQKDMSPARRRGNLYSGIIKNCPHVI
jgi:hypothetical protein